MEIRLLGPIEASFDGGPARLGPRQQQAVLAMLALAVNRTVSTDRLIEGLWGERAPASAPKLVQLYVSHLRKLLGEEAEIVTRGRGYELRLAADRVDVARFEDLVAAAANADGSAAALARQALALWRGAPLADVADEPFAAAEIRRLDELRLRATELAIDGELAAARHRELIGELDALVAEHPLSERLQAQRMLALYRSGRQAEALAAYRQAREVLVSEIGVEPGPELRRLHDAMLRQDAAALDLPAATPPPAVVPDRRTPAPVPRTPGRRLLPVLATVAVVAGLAFFAVSRWTRPDRLTDIGENSVGVIDPQSGRITAQYPVGRAPGALAAGGGSIWSLNTTDRTVSRIGADGHPIVPIAVGDDPVGLAYGGGSLWVTDGQDRAVLQVSPARNRVIGRIGVGNAPGKIAAGFGALWIASEVDPSVVRLDLASGAKTRIDLRSVPSAIAVGDGAVWVTSEENGIVYRIAPRTRSVADSIEVGNGPVGVAVGAGAVWVANRRDATVSRIDPATDTVTDLPRVGRDPRAIAAGAGGVWVANSDEATVTRIDPATRRPARTIRVKSIPSAIAVADGSVWTAALAAPARHRGGTLWVDAGFLLGGDPQDDAYGPMSLVYDGLVAYRRAGGSTFGTLVGDLATDVPDPSPDGRSYVFTLRPGIRYANGEPVRPQDFRAALEALFRRHPSLPLPDAYRRIDGVPACVRTPSRCDLSRGIATDARARTITLHLTRPDPDVIPYLAHPFGYMVPADHPFGRGTLPPGTGPYRVASFDAARGARLVRNPRFREWSSDARPAGFPDEIDIRLAHDLDRQIADVQHGRADLVEVASPFAAPLPPARLRALFTRDAAHVYTDPVPELDYMFLDVHTPPFDDVRVRRALNYAVDRREVMRLAGGPAVARPACQIVPPGFPGFTAACRYTLGPGRAGAWTAPDTARARRLIQRSGTSGMRVTVWGYRDTRGIIGYFAALLRRLGFRSSTRLISDYGTYRDMTKDPRTRAQIGIEGVSADVGAPSNFTAPFLCSSGQLNDSEFCDHRLEARIAAARSARGPRATSLWNDVYRRLADAAPAVPLVNRRSVTLVSSRVGNYQHHPQWATLLDQLWTR